MIHKCNLGTGLISPTELSSRRLVIVTLRQMRDRYWRRTATGAPLAATPAPLSYQEDIWDEVGATQQLERPPQQLQRLSATNLSKKDIIADEAQYVQK